MQKFKFLLFLALVIACMANSKRAQTNPTAVVSWNNVLLNTIIALKPAPPIASRAMSIMHTAMYDAWSCYDGTAIGTRFGAFLKRPASEISDDNKQIAFSYAAYRVMLDLFPTSTNAAQLMNTLGYDIITAQNSLNISTPQGIGNCVAQAILDYRHGDGSNQYGDVAPGNYSDTTNYQSVNTITVLNDLNQWQPLNTSTGPQKFVVPHWGILTTFARSPFVQNVSAPLTTAQSAAFLQQSQDLITLSAALNDTTKVIAEFWEGAAGTVTPPGIWCLIGQFVSQRDNHSIDTDVKMYFGLSGALMDAGIYAWITKRKYNSVRPITTIRNLFNGQNITAYAGRGLGTGIIQGQNWIPYINTPSFPEHASGHSTFSGAAAQFLQSFTGSSRLGYSYVFPAGASHYEPGITPATSITLSYANFIDAANDAGVSRRYGGIHFYNGDFQGRALGQQVGAQAYQTFQYYTSGGVSPAPTPGPTASASSSTISMVILALLALFAF